MSIDFLPNRAGPVQRQMAADYAARRARLFRPLAPPPKLLPPKPQPISPFDPRRIEQEIEEQIAKAVEEAPAVPVPNWKRILSECSAKYGVPIEAIVGASRSRAILPARYEAAYRMVMEAGMSYPSAGKRLNRDHTTVLHAVKRHVEAHPELAPAIEAAEAAARSVRADIEDEIIRLYFADGHSVKSIAEGLDVSRPFIHALVHREVVRVRKALEKAA